MATHRRPRVWGLPIMQLSDFDYPLPPELIAQHPPARRGASRLLHLDGRTGVLADRQFGDLPSLVRSGDVMVFNNTKVVKARLRGAKASGGRIEALVERVLADGYSALAHLRASKSPKAGTRLVFAQGVEAEVEAREDDLFRLRFAADVFEILERIGEVPLPPYIEHAPDTEDAARYQTVYAEVPGSAAAPTAGLHFDQAMLTTLEASGVEFAYVTLHVGAGTFQPVRDENIAAHVMHSEWYQVSDQAAAVINRAKDESRRVIAVGTTSLRTLESAARDGRVYAASGNTRLFITPGFRFQIVDRLITNFHLPKSTLMLLVAAFAGIPHIRNAYAHAVRERYRFFSYGDAMLLERAE
jgi:S-adenosylmethionine:tRNA ribosyltransferase-isomerase